MNKELDLATTVFCGELASIEQNYVSGQPLHEAVTDIIQSIKKSCVACARSEQDDASLLKSNRDEFRARIAPWFSRSWFMNRGLTKPRGYPGDFEILEGIYDKQPKTAGGIGEVLDAYFLQTELARAVFGRKNKCKELMSSLLNKHHQNDLTVLDIACGPCRELRELYIETGSVPHQFHGIDNDAESLNHARQKSVENGLPESGLKFSKQNVLRLISPANNIKTFGTFDLIYSVGLYDYLPDDVLLRIMNGTLAMVNSEGHYVVAFKDCRRYDKTEYQWHVDWHFYQRTGEDCTRLLSQLPIEIVSIERDEIEVILFYTLKRID